MEKTAHINTLRTHFTSSFLAALHRVELFSQRFSVVTATASTTTTTTRCKRLVQRYAGYARQQRFCLNRCSASCFAFVGSLRLTMYLHQLLHEVGSVRSRSRHSRQILSRWFYSKRGSSALLKPFGSQQIRKVRITHKIRRPVQLFIVVQLVAVKTCFENRGRISSKTGPPSR